MDEPRQGDEPGQGPSGGKKETGVKRDPAASGSPRLTLRRKEMTASEPGGRSPFVLIVLFILLLFAASLYYYYPREESAPSVAGKRPGAPAAPIDRAADASPSGEVQPTAPVVSIYIAEGIDLGEASRAAKEGDHEKAVAILREDLKKTPSSDNIKKALARSLNELGLKSLGRNDYAGAKGYFAEAAAVHSEPALLVNLASAKLSLNDYKGAAQTLETVSGEPSAKHLLADIYCKLGAESSRFGRVDEAREYYEKCLKLNPADKNADDMLAWLKTQHEAESKMDSTDGRHFRVKYEGGENAVTGHVISILLEEAYYKVGADFGLYPDDRIEAVLMTGETFRDITGSPSWAGALYDGRIKVPVGGVTEKTRLLEQVLFHEYTHAVVHRLSGGRAPVWLNEGLAQIEEGDTDERYRDALRDFAAKNYEKHDRVLRPLEGSFMRFNAEQAAVAYLLSLSATQYLTREYGTFSAKKILENLKAGMNMDQAFQASIYVSYEDFQRGWFDSLKR